MNVRFDSTWRPISAGPKRTKCPSGMAIPLLTKNPITQATTLVYLTTSLSWPLVEIRSKLSGTRLIVRLTEGALWLDTTVLLDGTPLKGLYI
jgi:hypothetical protein